MLLFYIRHGDPIYNPDSLTPLGKRQAEAVGRRLALYGLDEIYVSSSQRAIETCRPACEMTHLTPTVLDWCNEARAWEQLTVTNDSGNLTWAFHHQPTARLMRSREMQEMGENWTEHPAFQGKPFRAGIDRVRRETHAFLAAQGYIHNEEYACYQAEQHNEKRIALFAHQGFGLTFLSCLMDIPFPMFTTRFDISHSSMTVIEFPEPDEKGMVLPKLLQVSNDSHLYRDGLPTKYQNQLFF